ncbi:hypothetical protein ACHWQZ_G009420 [Mnemiopsis leidyi]
MKPDSRSFPRICLTVEEFPCFTKGRELISELENRTKNKKMLDEVIYGPDDVIKFFGMVFPEVKRQQNVGQNSTSDYKMWEEGENVITIEEDREMDSGDEKKWDLYVGGPAAIFGAVIQAQSAESGNVMYVHDGVRGISNWKGSASTYVPCTICPQYYGFDSNGLKVAFNTVVDEIHRRFHFSSYLKKVKTDGIWMNVRIKFSAFFADPGYWWLVIQNQWNAFKDVGLYIRGTALNPDRKTIAHTSVHHATRGPVILKELNLGYDVMYHSNKRNMSLDAIPGRKKRPARFVDTGRLERVVGPGHLKFRSLSREEITSRGYDPDYMLSLVERPLDGALLMDIDEHFERDIERNGGIVRAGLRLKRVLVKPTNNRQDCFVTKVVWEDCKTGQHSITPVKTLHLSLGPSMTKLIVKNNQSSMFSKFGKFLKQDNLMSKMMLATGSSMVFIVKIDKSLVKESKITKFRDDFRSGNRHWRMMGEREVETGGKLYHVMAIQASGGAIFPFKHAHPEAVLNIISAIMTKGLGLQSPGIEFDIVSLRSCSRGITSHNFLRFGAPAGNLVMVYGTGGLGMGTMMSNALFLKALLRQRKLLSEDRISNDEFVSNLKTSDFDSIPHWNATNPFARDYYQFIDKSYRLAPRRIFGNMPVVSSDFYRQKTALALISRMIRLRR